MSKPDPSDSRAGVAGILVFRICRGGAVAVLALAIYVALTNWAGDGRVWALRYAVIALLLYMLGRGVRQLLDRL